jgi:L-lactate dehydrogenase complex protein LldG
MSSRAYILAKIKAIPAQNNPLPSDADFSFPQDYKDSFIQAIKNNKGEVITEADLKEFIAKNGFKRIICLVDGMEHLSTQSIPSMPHELNDLEVAIVQGQFGVAENGAIWLTDENLGLRALPFIAEHLVIVLDSNFLVSHMHEAYQWIGEQHSGFGLFLAGPSKTADIEQSLVIGAHGAKSLRVLFKSIE